MKISLLLFLCSLFLEFLLAKVCASWTDLITYYSLLFSASLPSYPTIWNISLKFLLLFNFKILVILIPKFYLSLWCFPIFVLILLIQSFIYLRILYLRLFGFVLFLYGSYIVSGSCRSLFGLLFGSCCYWTFFSRSLVNLAVCLIWEWVIVRWFGGSEWWRAFQLGGFLVGRPLTQYLEVSSQRSVCFSRK